MTDDAVFQSVDDPNDVTVWHDFAGTDEARGFVSSEELRNARQRAGVQGEPEIWFVTPTYDEATHGAAPRLAYAKVSGPRSVERTAIEQVTSGLQS